MHERLAGGSVVRLLEADPALGDDLEAGRRAAASHELRVRTTLVLPGEWRQSEWDPGLRHGVGLLLLDGLLMHRVGLHGRYGAELLGGGDLLRPWQREDAVASVPRTSGLRVLKRIRIAVLDVEFVRRAHPYPEVVGALVARALRRSRQLAVNMAIVHQPRVDTRVQMLLWHLADRWGTVGSDGVTVPVRLTHTVIADLVAARRPTVSAALGSLERQGVVSRMPGGWRLHGSPPIELEDVTAAATITDGGERVSPLQTPEGRPAAPDSSTRERRSQAR